jgi:biopolymer transport protein ExbB/TolQ
MTLFWLLAQSAQASVSPSSTTGQTGEGASDIFVKCAITIAVIFVLAARWTQPKLKVDGITLGLLVLAAVPWLGLIISSIKLPGGSELVYRVEERQDKQEADLAAQQKQLKAQQDELAKQQQTLKNTVDNLQTVVIASTRSSAVSSVPTSEEQKDAFSRQISDLAAKYNEIEKQNRPALNARLT